MTRAGYRWGGMAAILACAVGASTARAEIKSVSALITSEVKQFDASRELQSDVAQQSFPGTTAVPPVLARARLDQVDPGGAFRGSAQVSSIFTQPVAPFFLQPPSDVGIDVAGYSEDNRTYWTGNGVSSEKRMLRISAAELGSGFKTGDEATLRSRVLISGAMIMAAIHTGQDLTGALVKFQFSVTQRSASIGEKVVLYGSFTMTGQPNGKFTTASDGVLALQPPPTFDLNGVIPQVPQVQAILFTGISFPYDYKVKVDEDYELELLVGANIVTRNDGVGCAAIFGTPSVGIGEIFSRVKNDDSGLKVESAIADHVDTSGAAYVQPAVASPLNLCGAGNGSALALTLMAMIGWMASRRGSRRRLE